MSIHCTYRYRSSCRWLRVWTDDRTTSGDDRVNFVQSKNFVPWNMKRHMIPTNPTLFGISHHRGYCSGHPHDNAWWGCNLSLYIHVHGRNMVMIGLVFWIEYKNQDMARHGGYLGCPRRRPSLNRAFSLTGRHLHWVPKCQSRIPARLMRPMWFCRSQVAPTIVPRAPKISFHATAFVFFLHVHL